MLLFFEAVYPLLTDFKKAHGPVSGTSVLYNIATGFGIPMKLVILIKTHLNETRSRVCVGKYLSDMLSIKNCSEQRDSSL